jgi:hypothetical protein
MVVTMTEESARLVGAWSSLAESTVGTVRRYFDIVLRCAENALGFVVRLGTRCEPAYLGRGVVCVGVRPPPAGAALPSVEVQQVGRGELGRRHVARVTREPSGRPEVLVDISRLNLPPGLYLGRVPDTADAPGCPFVIYLDGLP